MRTAALGHKQPLGSLSFHRLLSSAYRPLTGQIFQVYVLSVCLRPEAAIGLDLKSEKGGELTLTACCYSLPIGGISKCPSLTSRD